MDEELVRLEFRVPVWVHVDVEHGEIVSVHVDDVTVEGPVNVSKYSGASVEEETRQSAIELTRDNGAWPAWAIGFDHT